MISIKQTQHLLAYLGYYKGECDGIWGPMSIEACKAFQYDYYLVVDGIAGGDTCAMLRCAVAGTASRREAITPVATDSQNGDFWAQIRWFKKSDPGIACPCGRCGGFPAEPVRELMTEADAMREFFKKPVLPTSTVRCQVHNDELPGSVPGSYHVLGRAMDFHIPGISDADIAKYLDGRKASGAVSYWYKMSAGYFHFQVSK